MFKNIRLFLIFLFLIFSVNTAYAVESALEITVSGSSPDGYQLQLEVPHKIGMESDFSDIRFFSGNTRFGSGTSIPYWIEKYNASANATVWVPVPAGASKLYCQWDIAGETASESNISAVMIFGDEFTGLSVDSSKWDKLATGTYTVSGGVLNITGANGSTTSKVGFTDNYEVVQSVKMPLRSDEVYSMFGISNISMNGNAHNIRVITGSTTYGNPRVAFDVTNSGTNTSVLPNTDISTTYQKITIGRSGSTVWLKYNDVTRATRYNYTSPGTVYVSNDAHHTGSAVFYDYVYVKQYDSTPVTGSVSDTVLTTPDAAFSGTPTSGNFPLGVTFTDSSTGTPTSWSWNFGDSGTSTSQSPSHTYNAAGSFTVALTVTNAVGTDTETKSNYITANTPVPVAAFSANTTSGVKPLTVAFTDTSTNSPTSWSWDFGDSSTSTLQNPTHTYSTAGTYTVSLIATNAGGSDTETKVVYITVTEAVVTPVAAFSANVTSGDLPLTAAFTDSSANGPTSWAWTFGDGGTSTSRNPTHTYNVAGTYTVTLTATNAAGSDVETKTSYITVTDPSGVPAGSFGITLVGDAWALIEPGNQPSLSFRSDAPFNRTRLFINGEPAGNVSGSWAAGEVVTVNGTNLTEGGRYYNVSIVATGENGTSNTLSYRISTSRERAELSTLEEIDTSSSDALQENLSDLNVTGTASTIMSPFTGSLGKSAYAILFVLPFVFLWRQGEGMTLPSVLIMLVGSLLIGLVPESYWEVGIVAIVCAFAYSLWSISHQK